MTAYKPEKYAFMADEAVNEVLKGKIDYTLKYYMKYLDEVKLKAQFLTQEGWLFIFCYISSYLLVLGKLSFFYVILDQILTF